MAQLVNLCMRCGGKAKFALAFADPAKKGGKEKGDAPVPLVWACPCGHTTALVLTQRGAV